MKKSCFKRVCPARHHDFRVGGDGSPSLRVIQIFPPQLRDYLRDRHRVREELTLLLNQLPDLLSTPTASEVLHPGQESTTNLFMSGEFILASEGRQCRED